MRKRFLLSLLVALLTTLSTHAYDFQSGDLYYNITTENTVAVTSGDCSTLTTVTIPETVTHENTTYSVTSIGDYTFSNCFSLNSITIPNSVTSIGGDAFYNCYSLTSISIPNSVTNIGTRAFGSCSSLTSITIGNSVTSIGWYAFSGCSSLTSITIPNSVTSIGSSAFEDCSSLTSIILPNSVTTIGGDAFSGCSSLTSITIPNSVMSIGNDAFRGCTSLPIVDSLRYADTYLVGAVDRTLSIYTIQEGTKWIGNSAFSDCSSLTSITIPNSVTSIGNRVFSGCSSLTSVSLGNSVTSIGSGAFENCSALTSITIPNSVTSIGNSAFKNCYALTSITIGNSVTSIGWSAFSGCSSLTSVTIPNSVTSIGDNAFSGCSALTTVIWKAKNCAVSGYGPWTPFYDIRSNITSFTFGEEVDTIPSSCCYDMTHLTSITIPASVTRIENGAFSGCSSITSVMWNAKNCSGWDAYYHAPFNNSSSNITSFTFGEEVEIIPSYLCYGMSAITSITIPNAVTSIGENTFSGCTSLTSVVWNAKKCANWSSSNSAPFYGINSNITSFAFGEGVEIIPPYLCYEMNNLTSITIPNTVTNIKDCAFWGCESLTSITLPNSINSIGTDAFLNCYGLTKTNYIGDIKEWCTINFSNGSANPIAQSNNLYFNDVLQTDIVIPESVSCINKDAFFRDTCLVSVAIGNGVTSIGDFAFRGCTNLITLSISNSVQSIGRRTFEDCSRLISVTSMSCTPPSCEYNVFYGTPDMKTLVVPDIDTYKNSSQWQDFSYFESLIALQMLSSEAHMGTAQIIKNIDCDGVAIISATANYGYYFVQWSDGNTDNPRTITLNQDTTFTAEFTPYQYTLTTSSNNAERGTTQGDTIADYLTELQISAIANYGYRFTSWSDGNTDNPRTIQLTQDTALIAEFAIDYSIKCGDDLYWSYSDSTLTITGTGTMYDFTYSSMPWYLLRDSIRSLSIGEQVESIGKYAFAYCSGLQTVVIPNSVTYLGEGAFYCCDNLSAITIPERVTSIGNRAFYSCDNLTSVVILGSITEIGVNTFSWCTLLASVSIPSSVTSIGNSAFYNCSGLESITCQALTPPTCSGNSFYGVPTTVTVWIPCHGYEAYSNRTPWSSFNLMSPLPTLQVQSANDLWGNAQIVQEVDCDSMAIISASANLGYEFTRWSDGNTDNPRTIKLTQDTTLTAEFGLTYSGKCGDDLYWAYSNKEVKITGTGAMYNYTDNTMPWSLLRDSIKTVRVGNNATSIGAYAFANTPKLAELYIGTNVEDIGANAFAGCRRLYDIYCYPTYPPFAESNSFANYSVYLYIPCDYQRSYKLDLVWKMFLYIECIGSEDVVVPDNEVTVSPNYEDATFTWPVTDGADTYSLVITKDDITFCTLIFNAQGQLVSIAFKPRRQNAPAAEGTTSATYAEMTANGFRFTVTGLNEGSAYAYTLTVRNAANTVLETYTGDFTTLSNTPTGINESADEDAHGQVEKIIRDGQVLILRNGKTYDMMGQRL